MRELRLAGSSAATAYSHSANAGCSADRVKVRNTLVVLQRMMSPSCFAMTMMLRRTAIVLNATGLSR